MLMSKSIKIDLLLKILSNFGIESGSNSIKNMKDHKDLDVWKESMLLAENIYTNKTFSSR
jgi:hypothetical protein